jgi:hypothetical protein
MAPDKADRGTLRRCSDEVLGRAVPSDRTICISVNFRIPPSTSVIAGEGCAKQLLAVIYLALVSSLAPAGQQAVDAVPPPPACCFVGIEFPCFAKPSGSTFPSVVGQVFHRARVQMESCKGLPARPINGWKSALRGTAAGASTQGCDPCSQTRLATGIDGFAEGIGCISSISCVNGSSPASTRSPTNPASHPRPLLGPLSFGIHAPYPLHTSQMRPPSSLPSLLGPFTRRQGGLSGISWKHGRLSSHSLPTYRMLQ